MKAAALYIRRAGTRDSSHLITWSANARESLVAEFCLSFAKGTTDGDQTSPSAPVSCGQNQLMQSRPCSTTAVAKGARE